MKPFNGKYLCCKERCEEKVLEKSDLAALCVHMNLARKLTCPGCTNTDETQAIKTWQQLKDDDEIYYLKESTILPGSPSSMTVKNQIIAGFSYETIQGYPTAMEALQIELKGVSILHFLHKSKLLMSEAICLGLTYDMFACGNANWHILFQTNYVKIDDFVALNINFTRLLISGMPISMFISDKLTAELLHAIQFNRHAFDAAEGTEEQWNRIMSIIGTKHTFKWGVDYSCTVCKPSLKQ